VINGIASDKIAKYEGWGTRSHDPSASAANFLDRLAQIEGELTIKVRRAAPPTIDVAPSKT